MVSTVMEIMYTCITVHVVLSTSTDVCVVIKHTVIDWTNSCSESNDITISLTEAGGQSATRARTGVLITMAVTVIIHTLVLVLVLISLIGEIMHTCITVHAILSTSADVHLIMKHTVRVCDWTNCCNESNAIAVSLTEAGGQSVTVACTGVLITSAVTIITPAFIFILVLVSISPVVEIMHFCVAVHAVLSTRADVCVVIKPTVLDWSNCCRDSDAIA